jgi:hypothetical protein
MLKKSKNVKGIALSYHDKKSSPVDQKGEPRIRLMHLWGKLICMTEVTKANDWIMMENY